jgi:hypothetical protein
MEDELFDGQPGEFVGYRDVSPLALRPGNCLTPSSTGYGEVPAYVPLEWRQIEQLEESPVRSAKLGEERMY